MGRDNIKFSTVLSLGSTALISADDGIEVGRRCRALKVLGDTEEKKSVGRYRGLIEMMHLLYFENAPGRYTHTWVSSYPIPLSKLVSYRKYPFFCRGSYCLILSAPIAL